MKQTVSVLVAPLLLLLPGPASAQDLAPYRGRNRLLVVFAPSRADSRWRRQDALLAGSRAQFTDRDLVQIDAFLTPDRAALRARYQVAPGAFRVLLIGKDGHVADSRSAPVTLAALTGRIDRMPLRRDEMRRRLMRPMMKRKEER